MSATSCAVALLLLTDVSGSLTNQRVDLQREGLIKAFNSEVVAEAIEFQKKPVAVSLVEWGDSHHVTIGWRLLKTRQDIKNFTNELRTAEHHKFKVPLTALIKAMQFGVNYMSTVPCTPERKVIDISGDGIDDDWMDGVDSPPPIGDVVSQAEDYGITINGLPMIGKEPEVVNYYSNKVVTNDGFVVVAHGYADFVRAMCKKLSMEIVAFNTRVKGAFKKVL